MDDQEKKPPQIGSGSTKARLIKIAGAIAGAISVIAGVISGLNAIAKLFGIPLSLPLGVIPYLAAAGIVCLSYYFLRATKPDGNPSYALGIRVGALVIGVIAATATVGVLAWQLVVKNYVQHLQALANDAAAGRRFVYVTNQKNGSISAYEIEPTGALRKVKGSPFQTGAIPWGVAANPAGTFVYVANGFGTNGPRKRTDPCPGSSMVSAYSINPTSGALTPLAVPTFKVHGCGSAEIAVDPKGKFAYVVNIYSNNVSAYKMRDTGALTEVKGSPFGASYPPETLGFGAGYQPETIAVDPLGKFVYVPNTISFKRPKVPNEIGNVSVYSISEASGALKQVEYSLPAGATPAGVAIDATDKFAYVTNAASNDIFAYAINPTSGSLERVGSRVVSPAPSRAAADPAGGFVYVSNNGSNTVSAYSINRTTGALRPVGTPSPTGTGPSGVAVDPVGQFVYVVNIRSNNVSAYAIDAMSGALTPIPGSSPKAGGDPAGIVVTRAPAARPGNLYVADTGNSMVKEILAAGGASWLKDCVAALQLPRSTKTLASGFASPTGIAVDEHGNVYVTEPSTDKVKVILAASGYCEVKELRAGFARPNGIAVDSLGNIFVTESGHGIMGGAVKELVAVRGNIPASASPISLGSGYYDNPTGIAVDMLGNVYVADTGHGVVKELAAVDGSVPASVTPIQLGGSEFSPKCQDCRQGPGGVAVDPRRDLYVADTVHGAVKEFVAERGGIPPSEHPKTLGKMRFKHLNAIAVDTQGNVYVIDGNSVIKLVAADGYAVSKTLASGLAGAGGVAVR